MKITSKHIDRHDLLAAITADLHFPIIDPYGNVRWSPSWILSDAFFSRFEIEETLCDALMHSDGEVFQLDKTFSETAIRKEFPAAKAFYAWANLGYNLVPQHCQLAEHSHLLNDIAHKLGLTSHLFVQYDPLRILNESGLRLGELMNAVGRRVHERLTKKGFKETVAQRKRELSSLMAKTERYLDRLATNHPGLAVFRFELHYVPEHAHSVSLEETAAHLSAFIDTIRGDGSAEMPGFWWKRRHLPECGFGHHFILFLGAGMQFDVNESWHSATQGKGFAIHLLHSPENFRSWGASLFVGFTQYPIEQVAQSVRLMLASERYLRLAPHHKFSHCGMGELPPVARRDEAWSPPMSELLI